MKLNILAIFVASVCFLFSSVSFAQADQNLGANVEQLVVDQGESSGLTPNKIELLPDTLPRTNNNSQIYAVPSQNYEMPQEYPQVARHYEYPIIELEGWEKESKLHRTVGWSFFGTGLGLGIAGSLTMIFDAIDTYSSNETTFKAGLGTMITGTTIMFTGIGVLIGEAIRYNPYRRGEIIPGLNKPSWVTESQLYKAFGWSFFILGDILFSTSWAMNRDAGLGIMLTGTALFVTGIGLLIADAVKFVNRGYFPGSRQHASFSIQPTIYTSPEFSGIGLGGRF